MGAISTGQNVHMSLGTVLQNLAIPSHQRQLVRPDRGDEGAVRWITRRHTRKELGGWWK